MAQSKAELAIRKLASNKWQIIYRNEAGVQIKKPKKWSYGIVILLVVIPLMASLFYVYAFGLAVVGLILSVADYMLKEDKTLYMTTEQLEQYADGKLRIKGE